MTRIATYGSNQMYLSRVMNIQQRLHELNVQVTTEKKSPNYAGIASDANRLINFENERTLTDQYIKNNTMATAKLKTANIAIDSVRDTISMFSARLNNFISAETVDRAQIQDVQDWAYRGLVEMQAYLGTTVDGNFIFSGGRVTTDPINLPTGSLDEFQAAYDGTDKLYPTTRAAHLLDLSTTATTTGNISFNGANGTLNAASLTSTTDNPLNVPVGSRITIGDTAGANANDGKSFTVRAVDVNGVTGTTLSLSRLTAAGPVAGTITTTDSNGVDTTVNSNLTFAPGTDTITVTDASPYSVGQIFKIGGAGDNNGAYEIDSIAGNVITIKGVKVATEAASATITVSAESYYTGDTLTLEQRIDRNRTIDLGVYASDPAFEKAIRAMGLIAQGVYGTAGGLENNLERIQQAKYLIEDAVRSPAGPNPPFGEEVQTDLDSLESRIGINLSVLSYQDEKHTVFKGLLEDRIIGMENVDKTEAIALLMDDQRALEAAFQAMAKIRQMSLLQFL